MSLHALHSVFLLSSWSRDWNTFEVERVLSQPVHQTATYRCDDTRGCVMQFWPPDDEHMVLESCRGMKWTYCETKILCIKLVRYWEKYTEMHGQQKIKIWVCVSMCLLRVMSFLQHYPFQFLKYQKLRLQNISYFHTTVSCIIALYITVCGFLFSMYYGTCLSYYVVP